MLSQALSVIIVIDHGIIVQGHGREILDGLNAIDKKFLLQWMSTVQLPGENIYDINMVMITGTCASNVSLARKLQKHLSTAARKHGVVDQGKY